MPFFQGATDFDINGGNFYDIQGSLNNHKHDNSLKMSGTGNSTTFAPNLSRNDNRSYNVGYHSAGVVNHQSGMYNYGGGLPQNNNFPPVSIEDYHRFLAWQQQGSPLPPTFQPPYAVGGPASSPDSRSNGFTDSRGPLNADPSQGSMPSHYTSPYHPQSPAPQSPQPTSFGSQQPSPPPPSSQHFPPAPGWGNTQAAPHQTHQPPPPQQHQRSQSQPLFTPDVLSEPSEILSEPDNHNFGGFGAMSVLGLMDRLTQQAQISETAQPATRTPSAPATVPAAQAPSQPSAHATTSPQPLAPMPAPQSTSTSPFSQPPPLNHATKPQQTSSQQPTPFQPPMPTAQATAPVPSVPAPPTVNPVQPLHHFPEPNHQPSPSVSNFSASSGIPQVTISSPSPDIASAVTSMPQIPNAESITATVQSSLPVPSTAQLASASAPNVATSPFLHENQPPVSSNLTAVVSAAPGPFSEFPLIRPLDYAAGTAIHASASYSSLETKKKKKKSWLVRIGLKKKPKEANVPSFPK